MAVKYTLNGIEYNDVKTRGKEYQPIPPLVSDTIYNCNTEDLQESFNGGSIPTIVNAIEIDWNDAYLQRNNKSLNNTSDLLNILDNTVPAELFDEYTERVEDAYNSSYNYIQKTSILEHTIDNLKSTITYIESDVSGVKQSMGSIIEQTASGISTRVESLESQYNGLSGRVSANTSSIEQTANRITSKVESLETQYDGLSGRVSANTSSIEQTASGILARIDSSINDTKTEFKLDLSGIRGTVVDLNNNYSTISQSLTEISSEVYGTTGGTKYSKIQQNADEINAKVVSLSGSISEIKTTTDDISLQVSRLSGIVDSVTGATFNNSDYELSVVTEEAYVKQNGNLIANFNYTLAKHVKTESENNIINNYDFIENEEAYRNNDKTSISNSLFYVSIYDNIGLIRNNNVFCEVDPDLAPDDKKNELLARGFKLYEKYGNYNNQVWTTAMFSTIAPVSGSGNPGLNRRDYYPINSLTNFWTCIEEYENITSYWDLPKDKRPESFTIEFREDVKQPNGSYSNKLISRRIIKIGLQTSATLDITDDRIKLSVGISGIIGSTIEQSISGIKHEVFDENNESKIEQLSDRITQEVNDLSGTIGSTIDQSISGIKHEVYDADGKLNKTMQTAQSTINWIGDATRNYSSFTQAVSGIASEVAGTSGISSLIAQTATGIHASVVSGLSKTGIDIEHENINVSSDNFKIIDNNGDVNMYINNRGDLYISGNISNDDNNIYTESDWKNTFIPVRKLLFVHNNITPTGSVNDGYPIQHNFLIDTDKEIKNELGANINERIDIGEHFAPAGEKNAYMLDLSQTTNNINIYNSGISGSNKLIYFPYINPLGANDDTPVTFDNISFGVTSVAWRLAPIGHDYCGNILFETPDNEVCYGSYSISSSDTYYSKSITGTDITITNGFGHNSFRAETDQDDDQDDFGQHKLPNNYSLYFNIKASYTDKDGITGVIYSGSDLVITNKTGKNISLSGMKLCYQFENSEGIKVNEGYVQDVTGPGIIELNDNDKYLLNLFIKVNDNDNLISNTITFAVYEQDDPWFIRTLTKFGNQPLHYYTYNEFNKIVGNRFIITNHSRDKLFIVYNYENSTKLSEGNNNTKYSNITPGRFVRLVESSTGKLDPDIHNSDYVIIWPNSSLGFTVTKEENTYYSTSTSGIDSYSLTGIANYEKYAPVLWIKPDYISYNINEAKDCLFNSNTFGKQVYFTN